MHEVDHAILWSITVWCPLLLLLVLIPVHEKVGSRAHDFLIVLYHGL